MAFLKQGLTSGYRPSCFWFIRRSAVKMAKAFLYKYKWFGEWVCVLSCHFLQAFVLSASIYAQLDASALMIQLVCKWQLPYRVMPLFALLEKEGWERPINQVALTARWLWLAFNKTSLQMSFLQVNAVLVSVVPSGFSASGQGLLLPECAFPSEFISNHLPLCPQLGPFYFISSYCLKIFFL